MLDGTIPIQYKESRYNAPLSIWLPLKFPVGPPIACVKCDPKKFFYNKKCRVVDSTRNGLITTDYIRKWGYPNSNLTDFAGDLRISFAEFPPLYAVVPGQTPPSTTTSSTTAGNSTPPSTNVSNTNTGVMFNPFGANVNRPPQQQQQQQQQQLPPQVVVQPPAAGVSIWAGALNQQAQEAVQAQQHQRLEMLKSQRTSAYHLALTTALSARLGGALDAAASADKQHQLSVQSELQSRSALVVNEVTKLQKEREALDAAAHELSAVGEALDSWLKINEPRAQSVRAAVDGEIDPDEAITPADVLSKQAIAALSADMALEDTLAALDRALEGKKVQLNEYLSHVRAVSRKQFTARALSSKIASKQLSERAAAQVANNNNNRISSSGTAAAATGTGNASTSATLYPSVLTPAGAGAAAGAPSPPVAIAEQWQTSGGVLMNPLAAAANSMQRQR